MSWAFEQVVEAFEAPRDAPDVTEGPVWTGEAMLFSDIPNSHVMRYDPERGDCDGHRTETNLANGLKFGPDGRLHACEQAEHRVVRYEPDGSTTVVASDYRGTRLNAPNDLAFDGEGRLWFTDPYYGPSPESLELGRRSVYRADPQGDGEWTLRRMTHDTTNPNGILVSPDGERVYVAELRSGEDGDRELRAYPIEGDELGEYEVLHNFYPHAGIDGMCLDSEGNVLGAAGSEESGPGPMIYVIAPSGRVLETHPYPGEQPTNCAFGGADLSTLYVTGFDSGLHRAETDRTGYLGAP
jgi:gluconolactonase